MNSEQIKVMWIGITVFIIMGLFPPFREITWDRRIEKYTKRDFAGYNFFLTSKVDAMNMVDQTLLKTSQSDIATSNLEKLRSHDSLLEIAGIIKEYDLSKITPERISEEIKKQEEKLIEIENMPDQKKQSYKQDVTIDYQILFLQWGLLIIFIGGISLTLKEKTLSS